MQEFIDPKHYLNRFLLIVFTASSIVATICCIMMSPHFPEKETNDESGEDDVFDQPDAFEDFSYEDFLEYHQNYSYSR